MIRTIVLIAINLTFAVVLAASVMPVAIVMAPIIRETPAAGYATFAAGTAAFTVMNVLLWRQWKRR